MNLKRLNHILIPATKDGRDAFRRSRMGKLVRPLFDLYLALTREGRFLSVFWMLAGAAGLEVRANQIYILFSLVTGLLVASLLARRFFRMDRALLTVEAPRAVVAGETMVISLVVANQGPSELAGLRAVGPLLPWDGRFVGAEPHLAWLGSGETGRMRVSAVFSARGDHHIDPFYVGRTVPLGIALGPVIATAGVRFVVRPVAANVQSLRRTLGHGLGDGSGRQLASDATDLAGTRPYRPGDPVRDLHARSWARTGFPVVREYRQEPLTSVLFLVDLDAVPGADAAATVEAAVSLAAGVAIRLEQDGTPVAAFGLGRHLKLFQRAPDRTEIILDMLARAEVDSLPPQRWASVAHTERRRFTEVVWVRSLADSATVDAVQRLHALGLPVRVFAPSTGAPDELDHAAITRVPAAAITERRALAL